MQLKLSSLVCRIIVLQKYTVCFHEEARLEDCEFYLLAHQFIVLPLERQRLESFDGNQEPSVLQKKKELWLRSLTVKNVPCSEPSVSQLIDAIGHNQLEVLKENAEECLDLRKPKEAPVAVRDEAPITEWEAKRKEEQSEDIFTVPVHALVILPEEEEVAAACEASRADTNEAASGKSGEGSTHTVPPSVVSQVSSIGSPASLESLEESLDNPWNSLPLMSLTLTSSDERNCQHELSPKPQQNVAADSNTPDLLEPCSQDSTEGNLLRQPVQISSPSLLDSCGDTSLMKNDTARGPELSGGSPAPLASLSPVFPVLPSSHLQPLPTEVPH
ncbi:ACD protein, partial [Rhinopomastus cyanomelas]|nr:ACD protein [Rhinopomastus cyanomelas]